MIVKTTRFLSRTIRKRIHYRGTMQPVMDLTHISDAIYRLFYLFTIHRLFRIEHSQTCLTVLYYQRAFPVQIEKTCIIYKYISFSWSHVIFFFAKNLARSCSCIDFYIYTSGTIYLTNYRLCTSLGNAFLTQLMTVLTLISFQLIEDRKA